MAAHPPFLEIRFGSNLVPAGNKQSETMSDRIVIMRLKCVNLGCALHAAAQLCIWLSDSHTASAWAYCLPCKARIAGIFPLGTSWQSSHGYRRASCRPCSTCLACMHPAEPRHHHALPLQTTRALQPCAMSLVQLTLACSSQPPRLRLKAASRTAQGYGHNHPGCHTQSCCNTEHNARSQGLGCIQRAVSVGP